MNIQSIRPSSAVNARAAQAPQAKQSQQQQEKPSPVESYAGYASDAMMEYGVYGIAAGMATTGLKIGALGGAALGATFGIAGAGIGGMVGAAVGAVGAAYGGLKAGEFVMDFWGEVGANALKSNPNTGKALGRALGLGALGAVISGPATGLALVGITAAVGGYDYYAASKS